MQTQTQTASPTERYSVKYYDAKLSKKGRGVQVQRFEDKAAAESFAGANILYGHPAKVETVTVAFTVRYANPGTKIGDSRVAEFTTRDDAEAFAASNRLFGRPCTVDEVLP